MKGIPPQDLEEIEKTFGIVKFKALLDMGFSPDHSWLALRQSKGDVDEAITFCLELDDETKDRLILQFNRDRTQKPAANPVPTSNPEKPKKGIFSKIFGKSDAKKPSNSEPEHPIANAPPVAAQNPNYVEDSYITAEENMEIDLARALSESEPQVPQFQPTIVQPPAQPIRRPSNSIEQAPQPAARPSPPPEKPTKPKRSSDRFPAPLESQPSTSSQRTINLPPDIIPPRTLRLPPEIIPPPPPRTQQLSPGPTTVTAAPPAQQQAVAEEPVRAVVAMPNTIPSLIPSNSLDLEDFVNELALHVDENPSLQYQTLTADLSSTITGKPSSSQEKLLPIPPPPPPRPIEPEEKPVEAVVVSVPVAAVPQETTVPLLFEVSPVVPAESPAFTPTTLATKPLTEHDSFRDLPVDVFGGNTIVSSVFLGSELDSPQPARLPLEQEQPLLIFDIDVAAPVEVVPVSEEQPEESVPSTFDSQTASEKTKAEPETVVAAAVVPSYFSLDFSGDDFPAEKDTAPLVVDVAQSTAPESDRVHEDFYVSPVTQDRHRLFSDATSSEGNYVSQQHLVLDEPGPADEEDDEELRLSGDEVDREWKEFEKSKEAEYHLSPKDIAFDGHEYKECADGEGAGDGEGEDEDDKGSVSDTSVDTRSEGVADEQYQPNQSALAQLRIVSDHFDGPILPEDHPELMASLAITHEQERLAEEEVADEMASRNSEDTFAEPLIEAEVSAPPMELDPEPMPVPINLQQFEWAAPAPAPMPAPAPVQVPVSATAVPSAALSMDVPMAAIEVPTPAMMIGSVSSTPRDSPSILATNNSNRPPLHPPHQHPHQLHQQQQYSQQSSPGPSQHSAGSSPGPATATATAVRVPFKRRTYLPYQVTQQNGKWYGSLSLKQTRLKRGEPGPQGSRPDKLSLDACPTRELCVDLCESMAPPCWAGKDECKECNLCNVRFSMFNKGHHCRNCGYVVCLNCSDKIWPSSMIPQTYHNEEKMVRVCHSCHYLQEMFIQALRDGDEQMVRAIYASGNVNLYNPLTVYANWAYPVHCAISGGNITLVKWLIDEKKCAIFDRQLKKPIQTAGGLTPLAVAAMKGHLEIMHYLVHEKKSVVTEITDLSILQRALHVALYVSVLPFLIPRSLVIPLLCSLDRRKVRCHHWSRRRARRRWRT